MGVLEKFGVEMIGATAEAIDKAEDRELFREAMTKIGLDRASPTPPPRSPRYRAMLDASRGALARSRAGRGAAASALDAEALIGLPAIIRPSFTLAAPAAASPTTARNSSTSSSAASTPRRPTRC
jgi:carbamoyl-phosphate synthase large subunit